MYVHDVHPSEQQSSYCLAVTKYSAIHLLPLLKEASSDGNEVVLYFTDYSKMGTFEDAESIIVKDVLDAQPWNFVCIDYSLPRFPAAESSGTTFETLKCRLL